MRLKHCNALSHYYDALSASKLLLALQHLKNDLLGKKDNFLLREQLLWGQKGYQKVFLFNISRRSVVTQKELNY